MILPIYTGKDNEVLRKVAKPVKELKKHHSKLLKNMRDTLMDAKGLGLAAPQVGVSERLILANFQYGKTVGEKYAIVPLVNPEIIWHGNEEELGEEGCLSLPEIFASVKRYKNITVKFLDERGSEQILELKDLNARIVQHEIDHLDGKLFVDYLDASTLGKYEHQLRKKGEMVI